MTDKEKAKLIERAIKLVYDSLESHLNWTHQHSAEGDKFHKRCVREYSEVISILSKLY